MTLLACNPNDDYSKGPDWSQIPTPDPEPEQPVDPKQEQPTTTVITPTTKNAQPGDNIAGLFYTIGMQINVADNTFSTRLKEVADAGFKYVELKIKYSYGLHNKSDEQATATFDSMQQQMEQYGITVWSIHLPYEDKNWTSISASESIRKQSVDPSHATPMRKELSDLQKLCASRQQERKPKCNSYFSGSQISYGDGRGCKTVWRTLLR